jgi:hypothetical protein
MLNASGKPVELVGLRTCRWHGRWRHKRHGGGSFSLSLGCRFIHGAGGLSWVDVGWLVGVVVGSGGEIVAGVGGAVGDDE